MNVSLVLIMFSSVPLVDVGVRVYVELCAQGYHLCVQSWRRSLKDHRLSR